jgi:hypothetical protein
MLYPKIENRCGVRAPQVRGLLKWFWPGILGSVKGQLAETLDSGLSFGSRPMTLSHSKYVNQPIRPPLAAPVEAAAVFTWRS